MLRTNPLQLFQQNILPYVKFYYVMLFYYEYKFFLTIYVFNYVYVGHNVFCTVISTIMHY